MTILTPDRPKTADETLRLLRAWQGEAETQRQLALLRQAPWAKAPPASAPG